MEKVFNSKKLNLSSDEKRRLFNCMKQKEFQTLLQDYMRDMSDPKTRREQELYIQQLERQNQLPAGLTILRPKPEFCVKVRVLDDDGKRGAKVFVNICSSPQVDKAFPETVKRGGQMGTNWRIPYNMNPQARSCLDNKNVSCTAFDVIFNDVSVAELRINDRMRDLLIKTALEGVSRQLKKALAQDFVVLKNAKFKGGEPASLSIKDPKAASKAGAKKSDPLVPSLDHDMAPRPAPAAQKRKGEAKQSAATNLKRQSDAKRSTAQAFAVGARVRVGGLQKSPEFNGRTGVVVRKEVKGRQRVRLDPAGDGANPKEVYLNLRPQNLSPCADAPPTSSKPSSQQPASSEPARKPTSKPTRPGFSQPDYTIVERGGFAPASMQFVSELHEDAASRRPREIVVRISIPKVESASGMDLDITKQSLALTAAPYGLDLDLPYPVDADKGTAKFKRKKGALVVTLPVLPLTEDELAEIAKKRSAVVKERDDRNRRAQDEASARLAREQEAKRAQEEREEQRRLAEEAREKERQERERLERKRKFDAEMKVLRERESEKRVAEMAAKQATPAPTETAPAASDAPKVELLPETPATDVTPVAKDAPSTSEPTVEPAPEDYFELADLPSMVSLAPSSVGGGSGVAGGSESPADAGVDALMLGID